MAQYNVASLVSGGGSTYDFLAKEMKRGDIPMNMSLVMSSTDKAGAIQKAEANGTPSVVVDPECFRNTEGKVDRQAFGGAIVTELIRHNINVVLQNGWEPWTPQSVIEAIPFSANQHPGHPIDFGGVGMSSSDRVQTAVVDFQHRVNRPITAYVVAQRLHRKLDGGAVLASDECVVTEGMTPNQVKNILLPKEWEAQKRMCIALVEGTLKEIVLPSVALPGEEEQLRLAKQYAINFHSHH